MIRLTQIEMSLLPISSTSVNIKSTLSEMISKSMGAPFCLLFNNKPLLSRIGVVCATYTIGTSHQTIFVLAFLLLTMILIPASNITHLTDLQLICYAYGMPPTLHRGIVPLTIRDVGCS